jgi:hypothetical protein
MNDLPDGWVPLSHFDSKDRGKNDGHSPEYKLLVAAVKEGELRGLQDPKSRRYYVPKHEANRLLVRGASKPAASKDLQCESVCESLADIASDVGKIVNLLDRLVLSLAALSVQENAEEPCDLSRDFCGDTI